MSKKRVLGIFMFSILLVSICIIPLVKIAKAGAPIQATDFVLNGEYTIDAVMDSDSTEHWYRLNIIGDGNLEVRIMSYCSDALSFKLFNEDLSSQYKFTSCDDYVSGGSESSPVTVTASKVLSRGTYYFCVSGATGRYKLCGNLNVYGTNDNTADTYDSPYIYTLGTSVTGALTETDKEDWYKIVVSENGSFVLNVMSYCEGSLNCKLSNEDLSYAYLDDSIGAGSEASPTTESKKVTLAAGTYYLKIWDTTGKYIMNFYSKGTNANSDSEKEKSTTKQSKSKITRLAITARRGSHYIYVRTISYASLKIKYKGKTWKVSSGSSGSTSVYSSKALKRGKKVKVVVTKYGYKKKTKTARIK